MLQSFAEIQKVVDKISALGTGEEQSKLFEELNELINGFVHEIADKIPIQSSMVNVDDYLRLFEIVPIGLAFVNNNLDIVQLNSKAAQLFNRKKEICTNSNIQNYLDMKSVVEIQKAIEIAVNYNKKPRCTLVLKDHKSITYYVKTSVFAIRKNLFLLVLSNISNQKVKETVLIKAKERAESADKLKSSFLANISHEIRTPLNSVIGFSELLIEKGIQHDKANQILKVIYKNSKTLLTLLTDMIDIARLEAKEIESEKRICSLEAITFNMVAVANSIASKANKHHIEFIIDRNNDIPNKKILADELNIQKIFKHLIDNAYKFTKEGSITIGYKIEMATNQMKKQYLKFYIKDTGVGISDDKKKLIFKKFRQIDESSRRLYGGTGLGLSICKGLVEIMGGKIWVTAQENNGTEVYFTIPYIPVDSIYDTTIDDFFNLGNKRILIIEDNEHSSLLLSNLISDFNAKVDIAYRAERAIEICKKTAPEVAIIDSNLPDNNDFDVFKQMKKCSKIKVIALTQNRANDEFLIENKLCDGFIHRNSDAQTVFKTINRVLNNEVE